MQHQAGAVRYAMQRDGLMINAGLGTGKTRIGLEVARQVMGSVLVLCPKVVRDVWVEEATKWLPDQAQAFHVLDGTTKRRAEQLADLQPPFAAVINYESAVRLADPLCAIRWNLLILDESHRVKSASTKIGRLAHRLAKCSRKRLLLTGTPADRPLDWFSQARVMSDAIYGTSLTRFKKRYCVFSNPNIPQQITGYKRLDELARRVSPHVLTIISRDVIDLPASRDQVIKVQMSAEGRRAYDQMAEQYIADLPGDQQVLAENDLVKLLRLAQMTGGVMEADGVQHRIDTAKRDALRDWLRDLREPVVVVCRFASDLDAVHEAGGKGKVGELSGRRNDLEQWQLGNLQVLAVQIRAGGVGISLVRSAVMVFYSVGYSLIEIEQARGRVYRKGQDRPVTYVHFVARDTVDEVIARAHIGKRNVLETVRQHMRSR